jgi:hypothetical protein
MLVFELTAYKEQEQDEADSAQDLERPDRALGKQAGRGTRSDAAKDRRTKKDAADNLTDDSGLTEFAGDPAKDKSGQQYRCHLQKQQRHTDFRTSS